MRASRRRAVNARATELQARAAELLERLHEALASDPRIAVEVKRREKGQGARIRSFAWPLRTGLQAARDLDSPARRPAAAAWAELEAIWWEMVALVPDVVRAEAGRQRRSLRGAMDLDDLVQEGRIGAYRSAQTWSPTGGTNWRCYASTGARTAIRNALRDGPLRLLSTSGASGDLRGLLNRAFRELQAQGLPPYVPFAADMVGITEERARQVLAAGQSGASLDAPLDDGEPGARLGDLIEDESAAGVDETAMDNVLIERVLDAAGRLDGRWRRTIELRLEGMTHEQIGDELGVCRERVRQIEKQALDQLREELCQA